MQLSHWHTCILGCFKFKWRQQVVWMPSLNTVLFKWFRKGKSLQIFYLCRCIIGWKICSNVTKKNKTKTNYCGVLVLELLQQMIATIHRWPFKLDNLISYLLYLSNVFSLTVIIRPWAPVPYTATRASLYTMHDYTNGVFSSIFKCVKKWEVMCHTAAFTKDGYS